MHRARLLGRRLHAGAGRGLSRGRVPLVPLNELLADARAGGYAVGYFEAWDGYSLDAVIRAAELERSPAIVGFGCLLVDQGWLDRGGNRDPRAHRAPRSGAERGSRLAAPERGAHPRARPPRRRRRVRRRHALHERRRGESPSSSRAAHARGVSVEGELGTLPDGESRGRIADSRASLTDPDAAAAFVAATGVDALAVSIGNVHTLEGAVAAVDLDRLEAIRRAVEVPLVLHGGTGFPAAAVPGAIERGVAKFNVGTVLKRTYLDGLGAGAEPRARARTTSSAPTERPISLSGRPTRSSSPSARSCASTAPRAILLTP